MYLVLNNNNFFSDKSGNLEGLGSFYVELNLPKPKPTFSGNPVDYLKKPYPPANVNPNIRPQHNPIRSSDQINQGSGDQFMGYFGDQQSRLSSSSRYHSSPMIPHPNKLFVQRVQAFNDFVRKPIAPDDCDLMKKFLERMGNLKAYTNPFKGPDSFFYCIAKFCPNYNPASEASLLVMAARSGLAKNKDFSYVSVKLNCLFYFLKCKSTRKEKLIKLSKRNLANILSHLQVLQNLAFFSFS